MHYNKNSVHVSIWINGFSLLQDFVCVTDVRAIAWFQASAAKYMTSALFWDFTQRRTVVSLRRVGTTRRFQLQGPSSPNRTAWHPCNTLAWPFKIGCSETSIRNYHYALRKSQKSEDLKSCLILKTRWTCMLATSGVNDMVCLKIWVLSDIGWCRTCVLLTVWWRCKIGVLMTYCVTVLWILAKVCYRYTTSVAGNLESMQGSGFKWEV